MRSFVLASDCLCCAPCRAFVISGDKGNNNPEQFKGLMDPHIAVHGSFSVMVNYHSIGAYFTSRGGFALHNPQEEVRYGTVRTGARPKHIARAQTYYGHLPTNLSSFYIDTGIGPFIGHPILRRNVAVCTNHWTTQASLKVSTFVLTGDVGDGERAAFSPCCFVAYALHSCVPGLFVGRRLCHPAKLPLHGSRKGARCPFWRGLDIFWCDIRLDFTVRVRECVAKRACSRRTATSFD